MLKAVMGCLLSHWRRHPVQFAMLVLGLSIATAMWSAVQAINGEARASYARAAAILGQDQLAVLVTDHGDPMPQQTFVDVRRAGWLVSPVVEGELRFGRETFKLLGLDVVSLPPEARGQSLPGEDGNLISFISPPWMFVAHPDTALRLAELTEVPVRADASLIPGTVVTDIGHGQQLLKMEGRLSRLLLWNEQPPGRKSLSEIAPALVERKPNASGDLARLTDSFHLNLTAFGFLSFAVGFFIVHSAVGLAFEQRRTTFRTLRSLGLPLLSLVGLLALEALILSAAAGFAGVVIGYVIAVFLLPDVSATLKGLYGAEVAGSLTVRPSVWAAGLAIAMAGTLLSTGGYLWRVWRQPALDMGRAEAWVTSAERMIAAQAVAGAVLLVIAAVLVKVGSGLVVGFALMGGLLLGAALLLPLMLALLLKAGSLVSESAISEWFWADARHQLPGLSLSQMALLMALATNIGVGTMVASFRQTFTGWLDQRLAAELYVTARSEAEAARLETFLESRVDSLLPIWNVDGAVSGQPSEIFGFKDDATYRDNWPLIEAKPDVWDQVAAGQGLLVNEQLWRRGDLKLGERLRLPGGVSLPISGVYSDYGNPIGQVMISIDQLVEHYPEARRLRYGVRVAPDKASTLAEELRDDFGLPSANIVPQASIKGFSMQVFERTFTVTAALNILTLGVASLAMFASLLTLSNMRLPAVAPVWALGVTQARIARLELGRSLMLAAFTMLAAVPTGIGLAWVLLTVVNVEAFGWRLPLHLFPLDWLRLALFALLAAAVAAALPSWSLARTSPARLAKVFAHER